jgi:DNA-binding transcriptional MerR regulator
MALTVSALADTVGLSADTVRYYERVGLLPEPARSAAGYRLYDQTAVGRLRLIKGAQRAGLRLREIGELLQVADRGQCPCGHTETLLRERLAEVRRRAGPLARPGGRPGQPVGAPARPGLSRHDRRRGRLVVRPGLFRPLPAIGREVTAMPLLDCTPDCPCDDCPPGCC